MQRPSRLAGWPLPPREFLQAPVRLVHQRSRSARDALLRNAANCICIREKCARRLQRDSVRQCDLRTLSGRSGIIRVGRDQIYAVRFEGIYILSDNGPFGLLQDLEEVFDAQFVAADDYGQTAHEFRFESVFNEIVALGILEVVLIARYRPASGTESDRFCAEAPTNNIPRGR